MKTYCVYVLLLSSVLLSVCSASESAPPDFRGVVIGSNYSDINAISAVSEGYMPGVFLKKDIFDGGFGDSLVCEAEVVSAGLIARSSANQEKIDALKSCGVLNPYLSANLKGRFQLSNRDITYKFVHDRLYDLRVSKDITDKALNEEFKNLFVLLNQKFSMAKFGLSAVPAEEGIEDVRLFESSRYRVFIRYAPYIAETSKREKQSGIFALQITDRGLSNDAAVVYGQAQDKLKRQAEDIRNKVKESDSKYEI